MPVAAITGLSGVAWAGFEFKWNDGVQSLDDYQDIYIYKLDLRDFTIEEYDGEEEEYFTQRFDTETMENIGNELYWRLKRRLDGILPLNENQQIDSSRRSLVAEMKLSARFAVEGQGMLMRWLLGEAKQVTDISWECVVTDSLSGERVLALQDTQEFIARRPERPLAEGEDRDELLRILDLWARRFAGVLAEKKIQ